MAFVRRFLRDVRKKQGKNQCTARWKVYIWPRPEYNSDDGRSATTIGRSALFSVLGFHLNTTKYIMYIIIITLCVYCYRNFIRVPIAQRTSSIKDTTARRCSGSSRRGCRHWNYRSQDISTERARNKTPKLLVNVYYFLYCV